MSIFISELAFRDDAVLLEAAKWGILIASPIASVIGLGWLYCVSRGGVSETGRKTDWMPDQGRVEFR